MRALLAQAIGTVFTVFYVLIIARALLSWVRPSGYNRIWSDLSRTLEMLTEPILAPIRNALPGGGMGGIDWSPLIALLLLDVAQRLIGLVL